MKRILATAALLATCAAANAGLSFDPKSTGTLTPGAVFNPAPLTYDDASTQSQIDDINSSGTVDLGWLVTDGAGWVTATNLGYESGYGNYMVADTSASGGTNSSTTMAKNDWNSFEWFVNAPIIDFKFVGLSPNHAINGGSAPATWTGGTSIALIGTNMKINGSFYSVVLGYNDSATTHNDWDDQVVGFNFVDFPGGGFNTPVPEPESYAMMLAGLGLMGAIARRRKSKAA